MKAVIAFITRPKIVAVATSVVILCAIVIKLPSKRHVGPAEKFRLITTTLGAVKAGLNMRKICLNRIMSRGKDFDIYYLITFSLHIIWVPAFWVGATVFDYKAGGVDEGVPCPASLQLFSLLLIGFSILQVAINWAEVASE